MYQNIYEYDLPLIISETKHYEFIQPSNSEHANPWKQSFKLLVSFLISVCVSLFVLNLYWLFMILAYV